MKQRLEQYMLTKPEITTFKELTKQQLSVSEIADALGKSNSLASIIVKSLKEKGLIETQQKGGAKKLVSIADTNHAQYLADLIKNEPYVPWEDVLSYSNSKVLSNYLLSTSLGKDVSETTKWRALRNLAAHGMLASPKQAASNARLRLFIEALADYAGRKLASETLPRGAVIFWRKGASYLFKVKAQVKTGPHFHRTALTVFPRYGIQFVTDEEYYVYDSSGRIPTVEDYIVHTILIDPSSATYIGYAALLLLKKLKSLDTEVLRKKAEYYGTATIIGGMLHYVNERGVGSESPFPKWEDFIQLAGLYDIKLP